MTMYLAAILDSSLPKDRRLTLKPEGLRAVMAWLDARYLADGLQIYGELMKFATNQDPLHEPRVLVENALREPAIRACSRFAIHNRSWSTFGHIHSKPRNRLKNPKVEKSVYIYSNSRTMGKINADNGPILWGEEEEEDVEEDTLPGESLDQPAQDMIEPPTSDEAIVEDEAIEDSQLVWLDDNEDDDEGWTLESEMLPEALLL
ncbi:hypothetical protein K470DRAFT_297103 [Piedraia hortae CBS 480.64]|uniref:HAT C-terminal dimerisation domain-containing protein n=1 Tax=Piedraia hortae CBS 480.64 TaxID=1314780 RepID=A0A6A7BQQ4_9PEZI|nr:hypothetical protein K470DRAFT_297103 [Piedraia hortae CBS 480.64]